MKTFHFSSATFRFSPHDTVRRMSSENSLVFFSRLTSACGRYNLFPHVSHGSYGMHPGKFSVVVKPLGGMSWLLRSSDLAVGGTKVWTAWQTFFLKLHHVDHSSMFSTLCSFYSQNYVQPKPVPGPEFLEYPSTTWHLSSQSELLNRKLPLLRGINNISSGNLAFVHQLIHLVQLAQSAGLVGCNDEPTAEELDCLSRVTSVTNV
jgi:hypothetical protein